MRTSVDITNDEGIIWQEFAAKHNIIANDSSNTKLVADYFQNTWQENISEANLDIAFPNLKPHLKFYTALQVKFIELAARIPEREAKLILTLISSRGLKDADEDRMTNFNTIAEYFLNSNLPITVENFDTVVGRITTTGRNPLLWKTRLQSSELEAAKAKEEVAAKQPTTKTDEVVIPPGLDPKLHDWYRMLHRESQPEDVVSSKPVDADVQWKQRAQDAVDSIQSNNDRDEATTKYLSQGAAWGWELVYKQVQTYIERRKLQRSLVRR